MKTSTTKEWLARYGTILTILLLTLTFSLFVDGFATVSNLWLLLQQISVLSLVAIGMTMMKISVEAGFDLSLGALAILSSAIVAIFLTVGFPIWLAILLTLSLGVFGGLVNGFLTSVINVPTLIETLAMRTILLGVLLVITGGRSISQLPDQFTLIARGTVLTVPFPVILVFAMYILFHFFTTKTRYGYYLYTTGYNTEVAESVGINPLSYRLLAFACAGFFASLAGVLLTARIGMYAATYTGVYLLESVIAVFIGASVFNKGKANILGTFIGVLLLGVLSNGFSIIGASRALIKTLQGLVFLLAVSASMILVKND